MNASQMNQETLKELEDKKQEFADALSSFASSWLNPSRLNKAVQSRPHYLLLMECFSFGFALREKLSQLSPSKEDQERGSS